MAYESPMSFYNALLAEERHLAASLCAVRSKINTLAPVASLPIEILEEVFYLLISMLLEPDTRLVPSNPLSWSQTCRFWRAVALASPRLWSRIDLGNARMAECFLERSQSAPLSIRSRTKRCRYTQRLAAHANHLDDIDVLMFSTDMEDFILGLGEDLSRVQSLKLRLPELALNLALHQCFPSLRRVALESVAIPWICCRALTHLKLRHLSEDFAPSMEALRLMIQQSPNLVVLELFHIHPQGDLIPDRIPLHSLQQLTLGGQPFLIAHILSILSLTPHTFIHLSCPANLFQGIQELLPTDGFTCPARQSAYNQETPTTLRFDRRGLELLLPTASNFSVDPLDIPFTIASPRAAFSGLVSLPRIIDSSSIRVLELSTTDFALPRFRSFLASLLSLEELRVGKGDPVIVFTALCGMASATGEHATTNVGPAGNQLIDFPDEDIRQMDAVSGATPIVCPSLHTMAFGMPQEKWFHFSSRWLAYIAKSLGERNSLTHARGLAKVERLFFWNCYGVNESSIGELRGIIGDGEISFSMS